MKKRLLSLLLTAVLLTSVISSALPVFAAAPTVITTADALLAISVDGDYVLGGDIDLSGRSFTEATIASFSGTLDGDGYTVKGLDLQASTGRPQLGLIGLLTGTVKNLVVTGKIGITGEYARAGGVAATSAGTVQNCRSGVDITVSVSGSAFIGGVVGYNRDESTNGRITDCYNTGKISVSYADASVSAYVGGITCAYGRISGAVNKGGITVSLPKAQLVYAAGIAPYEAEVSNSVNEGDVTAVSAFQAYAGGMSAFCGSSGKFILRNNENRGKISATVTGQDGEIDVEQARAMAGGIAAYTVNTAKANGDTVSEAACTSVINACKNSGAISSVSAEGLNDYAGGIAGIVNGLVHSCVELEDNVTGAADGPIFGGFNPSGVLRGKVRDCTAFNSGKKHTPVIGTALDDGAIALVGKSEAQTAADGIEIRNGHEHFVRTDGGCAICGMKNGGDGHKTKFKDVAAGAFYEEAVNWAVENSVTSGTSETTFSPNNKCTRGQVVTFLWRAKGSPEPKSTVNPFTDVKETGFYYKAVLWAVENNVTAGLSATTFGPNKECTRGQVVTFLWRAKGQPAPSGTAHPFTDVKSDGFYFKAMLWAVENNVTNGTSATAFGPNKTCTRGQVVTFLYRAFR